MITEPQTDRASVVEDQKLRDRIESFERMFLDYRYPEVEDAETRTDQEPENNAQAQNATTPYI